MDDEVYVIITGHNLEAQCDVANVLIREKDCFQSFKCRENLMVESTFTANGKRLFIVATPPLNTPAWTRGEESINRFPSKIFLYIKDNDSVESDEQWFIRMLNERFGEQGRSSVLLVKYNLRNSDDPVKTNDNVLKDSNHSKQCFLESEIQFNKNDSFDLKTQIASTVFKEITELIQSATVTFRGELNVDDKRIQQQTTQTVSNEDEPILDTVTAGNDLNDDDWKHVPLPTLTDEDWQLYRRALRQGKSKTNHIRIIVIGNQGAGKTTLVKRLQNMFIDCPDQSQAPTEGLEINCISTRCQQKDGKRIWETKSGGYETESNLQRMADAMHSVKHSFDINKEKTSVEEIENTSQECSDATKVEKLIQYKELIENKMKVRFVQQAKLRFNRPKEETMYLSFWDFAGQTTYYSTHQAFLAPFAVYVLVIDLEQDLNQKICDNVKFNTGILDQFTVEETVKFWISSIKAYTRDTSNGHAPFIVVGTHKDRVTNEDITEKFYRLRSIMRKVTPVEYIAIDNTRPIGENEGLQDLRNKILDLGIGLIEKEIPGQWIDLEHTLMNEKIKGCNILSFKEVKDLDNKSDVPMGDQTKIEAFLDHQHSIGWLMHFFHIGLKDFIILDPAMVARLFNTLLSHRSSKKLVSLHKNNNGIVHQDFINETLVAVFGIKNDQTQIQFFVDLLTELHIMHHYKRYKYVVPCLLPHLKADISGRAREKAQMLKLSFNDAYVPPAFFHLLLAALLGGDEQTKHKSRKGTFKIYKNRMRNRWIYNQFACLTYTRDSLWLKTYWMNCSIFFEILNFSSEQKLVEGESNKIVEILTILELKINQVLKACRQANTKYFFEFECPEHTGRFVDLKKAREENDAMCTDENPGCDEHAVSFDDFSQSHKANPGKLRRLPSFDKLKPSEKMLGRLAQQLQFDTPAKMVLKLKMKHGTQLAHQTCEDYKTVNMQRLHILNTWMCQNPKRSLEYLLKRFTKDGDYNFEELEDYVTQNFIQTIWQSEDLESSLLQSDLETKDLVAVSECIGSDYMFLLLELGLSIATIEQRVMGHNDNVYNVYKLLLKWYDTTNDRTVRTLLDRAKFLNMNYSAMITKLKERRRNIPHAMADHEEVVD